VRADADGAESRADGLIERFQMVSLLPKFEDTVVGRCVAYIHFGSGSFALELLCGRCGLINIDKFENSASIELAVTQINSHPKSESDCIIAIRSHDPILRGQGRKIENITSQTINYVSVITKRKFTWRETNNLWSHWGNLTRGRIGKNRIGQSSWKRTSNHGLAMTNISELNSHAIRTQEPALDRE
jgi:hypothetical protein